jgi:hypothetical protein
MTRSIIRDDRSTFGRETISGVAQTPYSAITHRVNSTISIGDNGNYGYPDFPYPRAVGGAFHVRTWEASTSLVNVGKIWRGGPLGQFYTGQMAAILPSTGLVGGDFSTIDSTMGSNAYSKMKPTKPVMDLGVALWELRDLPGMFEQRLSANGLKNIGSYFLALKFGWEPLLRDIRNYVTKQMDAQTKLKQLLRDNGKPVRRRISLFETTPVSFTEQNDQFTALMPGLVTQYYAKSPHYIRRYEEYNQAWACARFRYWLPDGPRDINWTRKMLYALYGLNPSPKSVWNALPWTWMTDWAVDIGTMLGNMDAGVASRLAADYFYVMHSYTGRDKLDVTGWFYRENGEQFAVQSNSYAQWSHKTRAIGDPFGWNTPQNTLSGMQLSILGALGMSRLR